MEALSNIHFFLFVSCAAVTFNTPGSSHKYHCLDIYAQVYMPWSFSHWQLIELLWDFLSFRWLFSNSDHEMTSLFTGVEVNLSCSTPQCVKVGGIMESYTAFAEVRSSESLIFASNRSLDDARLKHFSKWVLRFRVPSISIPRYLYCFAFWVWIQKKLCDSPEDLGGDIWALKDQ